MMIQKNIISKHKYVTLKRVSKSQFDEQHNWCTFSRSYLALRTFWSLLCNKKRTFVYQKFSFCLSKPQDCFFDVPLRFSRPLQTPA